ncbi:glucagon-like peptide 1 receptor [Ambystoma mexicanum]|uniref:glucagon-like peptide 1 receptor n=1 Tax=Ambystoma mexicanum TaxID=8296 RepID=UPI0037E9BB91
MARIWGLLGLLGLCVGSVQVLAQGLLEETIQKWREYEEECLRRMRLDPAPEAALYCQRTFDDYACWPDTLPGRTVRVPCPPFLPWSDQVSSGHAYRKCTENGTWLSYLGNSSLAWRDVSECEEGESASQEKEAQRVYFQSLQIVYTVGYSLSLVSLVGAAIIFLSCRRLQDLRHRIHLHLFTSFLLRAVAVLVRDGFLRYQYRAALDPAHDWLEGHPRKVALPCRLSQIFLHYCIVCSYCWLLVEGLYLQALLSGSALAKKTYLKYYCLFGWGSPVIVVTLWVCGKHFLDNEGCWSENVHMGIWWIIRAPIVAIVVVNFLIFLRVLCRLGGSYRHQHLRFSDSKCRLAKSTLTLLPLLGVHEIIFVFMADEVMSGTARAVGLFFLLILNSFQGCLLSLLYCFAANEVQRELKIFWRRLRQKRPGGEVGSLSLSVVTFLGASESPRMETAMTSVSAAQGQPAKDYIKLGVMSQQDQIPQAALASENMEQLMDP